MKNQILVAPKPSVSLPELSLTSWSERENKHFSALLEESVTNRQVVLIGQAVLSGSLLVGSIFIHWAAALVCLMGFIVSLWLCRKGGLK